MEVFPRNVNGHSLSERLRTVPTEDGLKLFQIVVRCQGCDKHFAIETSGPSDRMSEVQKYVMGYYFGEDCHKTY